jgi:hypothetical protein
VQDDVWYRVDRAVRGQESGDKGGDGVIGYADWGVVDVDVDWGWRGGCW